MTPNEQFASYVTSTSFNLSLSRTMVVVLVEISNQKGKIREFDVLRANGIRSIWVPTVRSLEERGLIMASDPEWPGRQVLTEAGEHVVALLQIAGLVSKVKGIAATGNAELDQVVSNHTDHTKRGFDPK